MLVALLSAALNNPIIEGGRLKYGVGGYLPVENDAVIGTSDFMYSQAGTNTSRFITEMKTSTSYPGNEPWYRSSRVCQSMGALYYSGVPLLLCSPTSFKLLLESEDRKSLFCYPAGTYSGSPSSDDFVYVLGLLILSTRDFSGASNILPQSPVKKQTKIIPGTVEKRQRQRQQQQQQSSSRRSARLARRHPYSNFKTECLEGPSDTRKLFFLTEEEIELGLQRIEEEAKAMKQKETEETQYESLVELNQEISEGQTSKGAGHASFMQFFED